MRRSIIVGVDGSSESTDAALVAASLARSLDRRLILAHVAADPNVLPYGDRGHRDAQRAQVIDVGHDLLEAVADLIGEQTAERRVVIGQLGRDRLANSLAMLTREERADLLVVGSRPRHPVARALLGGPAGSPTASLASLSACPVVVVPRDAGRRFEEHQTQIGSVVCGVDGSPESGRALLVASELASRLGDSVLPVFATRSHDAGYVGDVLHVTGGDPAATLGEVATWSRAPLLVVGMRAAEARRRSVSRRLAARAPVPVVIVPPGVRLPRFTPDRTEPVVTARRRQAQARPSPSIHAQESVPIGKEYERLRHLV
jgi:nucleotide-binding universal stress UspA family protein